jgi:hypothetical protein
MVKEETVAMSIFQVNLKDPHLKTIMFNRKDKYHQLKEATTYLSIVI